jgi:amino acid permease
MPLHIIVEESYRIAFLQSKPLILKNLIDDEDGKHGSLVTIFSSWNAMVGTGMVTVPWAFQQSGVVLGIVLTFVAFAFSTYTCFLVIKTAGGDLDYTETIKKQFG